MKTIYNTIVTLLASVILVACSQNIDKDTYDGPRDKIYYGYYGDMSYQLEETKDHVNVVWIAAWDRYPLSWADCVFQRIAEASVAGKKSIVMMTNETYVDGKLNPKALQELNELFFKLSGTDYLKDVVAIYPTDEPDGSNFSSEEIQKTNDAIRNVMKNYPALKNTALAVIYTGSEKYPGIEFYDWVGFDDYKQGSFVLGGMYNRLANKLRPDQRTILVPGGCDKWRQDPEPFADFALTHNRVVAVVPFIWIDNAAPGNPNVGLGIRSNGMKDAYKKAALRLISIDSSPIKGTT